MKKTALSFLTGIILLVTLCLFPLSAYAAETVSVSIPVEIEGGGTAIVITEVNCPLPEQTSLEVKDGATENINIVLSVPGDYTYTIKADSQDESYYTPEYYTARVAVRTINGELTASVVLTKADSDYKPDACVFTPSEKPSEKATETTSPTQSANSAPVSRPQTGDDSMLDVYLLICIAASGGLFLLTVVYLVSTNRMLDRK